MSFAAHFSPETQNVIKLTLAFAKAVAAGQADKNENVVVSPYNAMSALAMVAKGAEGKTRDELAKTLFATDAKGLDKAVNDYTQLNARILSANAGQVEIKTANGVWVNKDLVTLKQTYADDIKHAMGAEIGAESFDAATVKKINEWADKNTNGLIKDIIQNLKPNDAAVLASSLYFKGSWTNKFDKNMTENETFTSDAGVKQTTPTMHQTFKKGDMRYVDGQDFEAVALTYGENARTQQKQPTMRIVLVRPKDNAVSARDFLNQQSATEIPTWLDPQSFVAVKGHVSLPRLDIQQKHDLIPALQNLGIKAAFSDASDFSRMTEKEGQKLYVSKVTQDVVFKTDEEGSEAAAVTTALVTMRSMPRPEPMIDFKVDRSFVFALQDITTGAVLFVGAVNKPNTEMQPQVKTTTKRRASKL